MLTVVRGNVVDITQVDIFPRIILRYGPPMWYSTERFEHVHIGLRKAVKNSNNANFLKDLVSKGHQICTASLTVAEDTVPLPPPLFTLKAHVKGARIANNDSIITDFRNYCRDNELGFQGDQEDDRFKLAISKIKFYRFMYLHKFGDDCTVRAFDDTASTLWAQTIVELKDPDKEKKLICVRKIVAFDYRQIQFVWAVYSTVKPIHIDGQTQYQLFDTTDMLLLSKSAQVGEEIVQSLPGLDRIPALIRDVAISTKSGTIIAGIMSRVEPKVL